MLRADYPEAKTPLLYLGTRRWLESGVESVPVADALGEVGTLL